MESAEGRQGESISSHRGNFLAVFDRSGSRLDLGLRDAQARAFFGKSSACAHSYIPRLFAWVAAAPISKKVVSIV